MKDYELSPLLFMSGIMSSLMKVLIEAVTRFLVACFLPRGHFCIPPSRDKTCSELKKN